MLNELKTLGKLRSLQDGVIILELLDCLPLNNAFHACEFTTPSDPFPLSAGSVGMRVDEDINILP